MKNGFNLKLAIFLLSTGITLYSLFKILRKKRFFKKLKKIFSF